MEEKEAEVVVTHSTPPAVIVNQDKKHRFAKIFFNMTVASILLIAVALLSALITPLLYIVAVILLFLICVIMFLGTLGAAVVYWGNPVGKVWSFLGTVLNSGGEMGNVIAFCFNICQWFAVAGIALSVGAIVFLSISKNKNKVAKIVCASILLAIFIIVLVFYLLTGGMLWQS